MKIYDYEDFKGRYPWELPHGKTPEDNGIYPLIETEQAVDVGDTLIIKNTAYRVFSLGGEGKGYSEAYVGKVKSQKILTGNEMPEQKQIPQNTN